MRRGLAGVFLSPVSLQPNPEATFMVRVLMAHYFVYRVHLDLLSIRFYIGPNISLPHVVATPIQLDFNFVFMEV